MVFYKDYRLQLKSFSCDKHIYGHNKTKGPDYDMYGEYNVITRKRKLIVKDDFYLKKQYRLDQKVIIYQNNVGLYKELDLEDYIETLISFSPTISIRRRESKAKHKTFEMLRQKIQKKDFD